MTARREAAARKAPVASSTCQLPQGQRRRASPIDRLLVTRRAREVGTRRLVALVAFADSAGISGRARRAHCGGGTSMARLEAMNAAELRSDRPMPAGEYDEEVLKV